MAQAGLELVKSGLPLPVSARIRGVCHRIQPAQQVLFSEREGNKRDLTGDGSSCL